MSKINLTPNAGGTGTLTVTSPNTNTDYTLTLPAVTGTFNTSGAVNEVPAGTVSAPSIYFSGDTNTGIYSPGSDTIAFTEGGVESMRLDSSGNLLVGTTSASTPSSTGFISTANTFGFKNRIINGRMEIDQRNAGAAVTINTGNYTYTVDRWAALGTASDGVYTVQRSTTAPAGFTNSLLATVTTADASIGSSQFYIYKHAIEGFNVADLGWGTASAKTITLSFWVRSSVTGTFSGSLTNSAYNRAYPFSYTVNAANTFEYKTITIAGDTSGTWLTDNSAGIVLYIDLGSGSSNKATAGSWGATGVVGATGSVNLISTLNATLYLTGVQLEVGTVATSFDYRPYGTELALCQRYYFKTFPQATAPAQNTGSTDGALFAGPSTNNVTFVATQKFSVTMRAAPTVTTFSPNAASANWTDQAGAIPTATVFNAGQEQVAIRGSGSTTAGGLHSIHLTASIEL